MSSEASIAEPKTWRAIHCVSTLVLNFASEFFTSISNISGGLANLLKLLGLTDLQGILSIWPESIRVPRARIERPETLLDGIYAGCIGFVQIVGGSVLGIRDICDHSALEYGLWRFCTDTAQRIVFVLTSPAVAILVFVAAVAAGISSALRHKSVIEKTRPRRVFPPEMTVSQYRLHTSRAMTLLEASTKKSLVPGTLQSGIVAYPLPQSRAPRPRRQHHGEESKRNLAKDYLLVTSDFVVCLRDGKAQWVCRKEDIQECSVNMPAYIFGALLAQQDLFVRNREKPEAAYAPEVEPHGLETHERASYDQGSSCIVHVKVTNQLRLPEDVLRSFSAAYKAYLRHATAKRSVVQALRDNFKAHFGGSDPSTVRHLHSSQARVPHQQNRTAGTRDSDAVPLLVEDMACILSNARSVQARNAVERGQSGDPQGSADYRREGLQTSSSHHRLSFLGLLSNCQACWRRRILGSTGNLQRGLGGPSSWWDWLRFLRRRKPPSQPEEVTFTVRSPDRDMALQVFDALCSTTECYLAARRRRSKTDRLN